MNKIIIWKLVFGNYLGQYQPLASLILIYQRSNIETEFQIDLLILDKLGQLG